MTNDAVLLKFEHLEQRGFCESRSGLMRMVRNGEFPKPINIGRLVRWRADEVEQWARTRFGPLPVAGEAEKPAGLSNKRNQARETILSMAAL